MRLKYRISYVDNGVPCAYEDVDVISNTLETTAVSFVTKESRLISIIGIPFTLTTQPLTPEQLREAGLIRS